MEPEMDFDSLLMSTLIECGINSEDGSFYGYVDTEENFKNLMTNIQACGYFYSIRGSHVYPNSQKKQVKSPPIPGDDSSTIYGNAPDSLDVNSLYDKAFKDKDKTSIHFKSQQGSVPIPYFGLGFSIERNTYFECSQGPRYYKKRLPKENVITDTGIRREVKHRNASTKKRNCPAVILLKCIRIYPEYVDAGPKEPHWKVKREIADQIRKALKSSPGPLSFLRYYIKASPQSCHSHETEAEKERRLFARYELKKERSRRYKKARLLRKRQQQESVDVDGTLELHKKREILPASCMEFENDLMLEQSLEASEEIVELTIGENQLEMEDHMVMDDGQLLQIKVLDDEQLEIEDQVLDTEEEDISDLLLSLQNEAQRIITLSSSCKNVSAINQSISLLKEASALMEEPPQLVTTSSIVKKVTIPINEVFTSHSDNFFSFTLNNTCSTPTCVVFVQ